MHALYKGNVTWPLIASVVIETIVFTGCGSSAIRHLSFSDDGGCLPMYAPVTVLYLRQSTFTVSCIPGLISFVQQLCPNNHSSNDLRPHAVQERFNFFQLWLEENPAFVFDYAGCFLGFYPSYWLVSP